jgi:hypothetical protein
MPSLYPRPGREFISVPLGDHELARLRPVVGPEYDFVYDGVLYLNDDESEDTRA